MFKIDYTKYLFAEKRKETNMSNLQGKANVVLEAVGTENRAENLLDEVDQDRDFTNITLSHEQFLRVDIRLPEKDASAEAMNLSHLVLAVDNSGSMSGQPWKQVQQSLHAIVGSCISQPNIKLDLIVYNTQAYDIQLPEVYYEATIDGLKPTGMTNFVSAFRHIASVVSKTGPEYTQTTVVILTDGQDTVNNQTDVQRIIPELKAGFEKHRKQAVVHTVGFSTDHDFRFLKAVAENGGTTSGMFRYCEPGENKQALQQKLDELFDFILHSNDRNVTIKTLSEKCKLLGKSGFHDSATVKAKLSKPVDENGQNCTDVWTTETWIKLENPDDIPELLISVENSGKQTVCIPCIVERLMRRVLETAAEKTEWRLRIMERNVEELMGRTASKISEKGDVSQLQAKVDKIQKKISHTKVFGNGIAKESRAGMLEMIKYIQSSLDQVQSMLTDYMRSGTDSISLLARAHDMRYQAVFSKGRRQRVMDKRAATNMKHAVDAQNQLANLSVDTDEIKRLSQDALQFFFCILSQNSVKDVLLGDSLEDGIGFGLAVKRSEVVLDEPTLIRLHVISGTLVSRSAMLDALEYKLNVSSHLKAHGGFDFDPVTLGVTTVGTSREPINAWLPLYVTRSHWERIKLILKPALGSFCTLDPLGYHYKQLDVLFMVLGSMIGQMSAQNVGEHQLRLLFAVLRTCAACLVDFGKEKEVTELVKNFVDTPSGRTKDIIPNLCTLIGYVVTLPEDARKEIFGQTENRNKFWLAFISEWLRRAAGPVYHDSSMAVINGVLRALLNGLSEQELNSSQDSGSDSDKPKEKAEMVVVDIESTSNTETDDSIRDIQVETNSERCQYADELVRLCREADTLRMDIGQFDPASDVTVPDVKLTHCDKVDRAMEVWAEKTTGHQKNIGKTRAYKEALRRVQQWLRENRPKQCGKVTVPQNAVDSETEDAENTEDTKDRSCAEAGHSVDKKPTGHVDDKITVDILRVIAHVQHNLSQGGNPWLTSFPGMIAFVKTWLETDHDLADIDANSGIAPDTWVDEVKSALHEICQELDKKSTTDDAEVKTAVKEEHQSIVLEQLTVTKDVEEKEGSDEADPAMIDSYTDDDDDEDSVDYNSNVNQRKRQKEGKKRCASLPEILRYIAGNLDVVRLLRAMLCQAVRYHSNSSARTACTNKQLVDISDNQAAETVIKMQQKHLEEIAVNTQQNLYDKAFWKSANHCMICATTPWAFVGYLMNTHSSRLEGFSELISLFMRTVDEGKKIAYLAEKVHILLTGQYMQLPVLDNGNQWLPEKKMASNFRKLLGDEVWMQFEIELRSSVQIHVYRESDIPNRHGHCNSNPYIPNALRAKLGMELMPEGNTNVRNSRKKRRR